MKKQIWGICGYRYKKADMRYFADTDLGKRNLIKMDYSI